MNDTIFWGIIETAVESASGNSGHMVDRIREQLVRLSAAEIESFQQTLNSKLSTAYSWKLWGAAYLINGGCSDDGFEYFRCWLISRGRRIFDAAVADPDSLADAVNPDEGDEGYECESLLYIAQKAYKEVTGQKMALQTKGQTREPSGESWDFDDQTEMANQLPRLSSIYG